MLFRSREINEDYFGTFSGSYGRLLIVCDGMGGHEGGEIASRLAVETIRNYFENLGTDFNPDEGIKNAIQKANEVIIAAAKTKIELSEMGSTVVLVLVKDGYAYAANLGDSRIYRIRNGEIQQITTDHSLVQQMVDSNVISPEEAKTHPKKNIITKALGIDEIAKPELPEPFQLMVNDCLILCTDGLTNHVNNNEIREICASNNSQDAAEQLVDLANERGGTDNITVQVMKVLEKAAPAEHTNKKSNIVSYTILLISIAALVFILFSLDVINLSGNPVTKQFDSGNTPSPAKFDSSGKTATGVINEVTNNDKTDSNLVKEDSTKINNEEEQQNENNSE